MEKVLFTGLTGRSGKYLGDLLVQNGLRRPSRWSAVQRNSVICMGIRMS